MTPYAWRINVPAQQQLLRTTRENLIPVEELVGSTHAVLGTILFDGI